MYAEQGSLRCFLLTVVGMEGRFGGTTADSSFEAVNRVMGDVEFCLLYFLQHVVLILCGFFS